MATRTPLEITTRTTTVVGTTSGVAITTERPGAIRASLDGLERQGLETHALAFARPHAREHGLPVSSFRDLLDTLATLCRNHIRLRDADASYDRLTGQDALQRRSFELLDINPNRV